eukprot:SAG22_NODE_1635_length_3925_cov_19.715107_5_plen_89_part_00
MERPSVKFGLGGRIAREQELLHGAIIQRMGCAEPASGGWSALVARVGCQAGARCGVPDELEQQLPAAEAVVELEKGGCTDATSLLVHL